MNKNRLLLKLIDQATGIVTELHQRKGSYTLRKLNENFALVLILFIKTYLSSGKSSLPKWKKQEGQGILGYIEIRCSAFPTLE